MVDGVAVGSLNFYGMGGNGQERRRWTCKARLLSFSQASFFEPSPVLFSTHLRERFFALCLGRLLSLSRSFLVCERPDSRLAATFHSSQPPMAEEFLGAQRSPNIPFHLTSPDTHNRDRYPESHLKNSAEHCHKGLVLALLVLPVAKSVRLSKVNEKGTADTLSGVR